jgi:hypothetical protein
MTDSNAIIGRHSRLRWGATLASFLIVTSCGEPPTNASQKKVTMTNNSVIDLVPGKSLGKLALGAPSASLPKHAMLSETVGALDGLTFSIADGRIEDIWIDDLRKFAGDVRYLGKVIPRDAPLEAIKNTFGPCEPVAVKGGVFFNCSIGVSIGCDSEGRGEFIQLRLRLR